MKSVELFAGGGGLALGAHQSGFESILAIEWEKNSCSTLRLNASTLFNDDPSRVHEGDVRKFDSKWIFPTPLTLCSEALLASHFPSLAISVVSMIPGIFSQSILEYLLRVAPKPSLLKT